MGNPVVQLEYDGNTQAAFKLMHLEDDCDRVIHVVSDTSVPVAFHTVTVHGTAHSDMVDVVGRLETHLQNTGKFLLDIDLDFFTAIDLEVSIDNNDVLLVDEKGPASLKTCLGAVKAIRLMTIRLRHSESDWCQQLLEDWRQRMRKANIYWSKHVGGSRGPGGAGTTHLDARIDTFLEVLASLRHRGILPSLVTLVDSTPVQPFFQVLDKERVGTDDDTEAYRDSYETNRVGGPYVPPQVAFYLHQRLVQGLRRVYNP
jgi:hypothetical protein